MLVGFVEQSQRVPLASARHVHWYRFDEENFELAKRAHQAHHEICDALFKGQAVRAEALMREHIYFSQRLIAEHVRERLVGFDTQAARPDAGRDVTAGSRRGPAD
jgi:GntR family transcriptional regulator of vanillate catabolism